MCPRGLPPSRCTSTGGCAPSARSAAAAASVFASTGGNAASARNAAAKASASTGGCAAPARSAVRRTPCTRCVAARARKRHWPALADAAALRPSLSSAASRVAWLMISGSSIVLAALCSGSLKGNPAVVGGAGGAAVSPAPCPVLPSSARLSHALGPGRRGCYRGCGLRPGSAPSSV